MSAGFYRFTVGDFRCVALHDGGRLSPIEQYAQRFPTASLEEVQAALHKAGQTGEEIANSYNCLFIENGLSHLLVDSGMGESDSADFGLLVSHMKAAGIQPEDVNQVFISHFHGDHYRGLMTEDDQRVFPNARYIAAQAEWDYWLGSDLPDQAARTEQINKTLQPLAADFSFVRDGDEITPGIQAIITPGHTPGHTSLLLESNGEQMMYLADLLAGLPQLVHPEWHFAFDTDSAQAALSRQTILAKASAEKLLVMFYHLPFPGVGTVVQKDGGYRWQPVE